MFALRDKSTPQNPPNYHQGTLSAPQRFWQDIYSLYRQDLGLKCEDSSFKKTKEQNHKWNQGNLSIQPIYSKQPNWLWHNLKFTYLSGGFRYHLQKELRQLWWARCFICFIVRLKHKLQKVKILCQPYQSVLCIYHVWVGLIHLIIIIKKLT